MIKGIFKSVFAASVFLASGSAFAEPGSGDNAFAEIDRRFYVSPMYSYTFASTRRDTDSGRGYTGTIGKQLNDYFTMEVYTFGTKFHEKSPDTGEIRLRGYGLGVMGSPFAPRDDFWGHWLGGAYGLTRVAYGVGKSDVPTLPSAAGTRFVLDAGVGYLFRIPFFPFAKLRIEANYRIDYGGAPFASVARDDNNGKPGFDDVVVSAGLLVPIGAKPAPPPPEVPDQPLPIAVVAPVEVPPPPKPACQKPAPGEKISLDGCGTGDVIVLDGVNFDFNKASLTVNARTILDEVAGELTAHPDIKVELAGHTDGRGSAAYNQKLSQKRAEAVRSYFIEHGIDADRMTAVGYGMTQPIASNDTDEGRAQNRRTELRITASNGEVAQPVPGSGSATDASPAAPPDLSAPAAPQ